MAMIDDVKQAFSGDRGKILLAGGAVAIGLILWTRRGSKPEPVPGEEPEPTGGKGTHLPGAGTAPGGIASGGQRPTTNAAWLSMGVDHLKSKGIDPADAHTALVKALDGQPLTSAQYSMVSQVIGALGSPPEGMPPLSHTAPPVVTPPGTAPRPLPPPKPGSPAPGGSTPPPAYVPPKGNPVPRQGYIPPPTVPDPADAPGRPAPPVWGKGY